MLSNVLRIYKNYIFFFLIKFYLSYSKIETSSSTLFIISFFNPRQKIFRNFRSILEMKILSVSSNSSIYPFISLSSLQIKNTPCKEAQDRRVNSLGISIRNFRFVILIYFFNFFNNVAKKRTLFVMFCSSTTSSMCLVIKR